MIFKSQVAQTIPFSGSESVYDAILEALGSGFFWVKDGSTITVKDYKENVSTSLLVDGVLLVDGKVTVIE